MYLYYNQDVIMSEPDKNQEGWSRLNFLFFFTLASE